MTNIKEPQNNNFFTRAAISILLLFGLVTNAFADSVVNSGFEDGLSHWHWGVSHNAQASAKTVSDVHHGGKASLRLSSRSPHAPNVFGGCTQTFTGLRPLTRYQITLWVKGRDVGTAWIGGGPGWRIRQGLPKGTYGWRKCSVDFTTKAKQQTFAFRINVDSTTGALWIDDVEVHKLFARGHNLVANGSFESGSDGALPNGWHFIVSRHADVTMAVDSRYSVDGSRSLVINNKSSCKPNVFGSLYQDVKLRPGKRYYLSCQARCDGASDLQFILGKRWMKRFHLKGINKEWKRFEFEFTAEPKDFSHGNYMIRLNTDGTTKSAYIDSICIVPVGVQVVGPDAFQHNLLYLLPELHVKLEALKTIPTQLPQFTIPSGGKFFTGGNGTLPAATDLNGRIALGWDQKGLIFLADVNDNRIETDSKSNLWQGDSVQLRIDQEGLLNEGEKHSDLELGFSPAKNGVKTWCWKIDRPLSEQEARVAGGTRPGGYFIAAHLSWSFLNRVDFKNKKPFSFNVVINDNDGKDRRIAFLAHGIHISKSSLWNALAVFNTGKPQLDISQTQQKVFKSFSGKIVAAGITRKPPWTINAVITDAKQKTFNFSIPASVAIMPSQLAKANFKFPLDKISCGPFTVKFSIPGIAVAVNVAAIKVDLAKKQLQALDRIDRTVANTEKELEQLYPNGKVSRYIELLLTEIKRQATLQRNDLQRREGAAAHSLYLRRGEIAVRELNQAAQMLAEKLSVLRRGGKLPATWMYVSSPTVLDHGWLKGEAANEQGQREKRDILFVGYGHFGDTIRDLSLFPKLGGNIIQIEIGPSSFFPNPGNGNEFSKISLDIFKKRIDQALKRAWENNMKVCLLLSPHYSPNWWLKKHPELKAKSGFLKYEVNCPEARKMIKCYLNIIIPLLKQSPYRQTLHSLCLSNEPVYIKCSLNREFSREQFVVWLKKKFGPVAEFNRQTGNHFKDYSGLLAAGMKNTAVAYEFNLFKRDSFAGWHRWMAEIVHKMWPKIPLSAKIMMGNNLVSGVREGVDPELFAVWSDLNGNDNYMNYGKGRWISNWLPMALGHDLQFSMKPTSICNSENHVIKDKETNPIPYDHIYTATFQQLLQGVGTVITWVWADLDYRKYMTNPSLRGNIFRRPMDVIAQGMAALDGNRIAPEIIRFCQCEPQVALLYSPTSSILNGGDYASSTKFIYTNLSFTGYKLGFRSEKQLAAGNFGKVKVLFLPDVRNISRDALLGLRKFASHGGKIVVYGDCLKQDEFGRPLDTAGMQVTVLPKLNGQGLIDKLCTVVADKVKLPFSLSVSKKGNEGVLWNTAICGNETLVNLVNYNLKPRRVKLTVPAGCHFVNLVSGQTIPLEFDLKPLHPLLLRLVK